LPVIRRRGRAGRLLILDDVFPNLVSGFRVSEFNAYLRELPSARVLSTPHWWPTAGGVVGFEAAHAEYADRYPELAGRVGLLASDEELPPAELAYLVFLNNAASYLPRLTERQLPFLVTIYPGGGMQLGDTEADHKLRDVLGSPLCRGVVTTQRVTREYLVTQGFIAPELVTHVPGLVAAVPTEIDAVRVRYGYGKDTLDIAFAAHRYTPHGLDKGYDVFIEAAEMLAQALEHVRFHVVGPWESDGYPAPGLAGRLTYHGTLVPDDLHELCLRCDVIVSPNRPFVLSPGGYDGFPLTTCVDAGLRGTAVVASNELQEDAFRDGIDLLIVRPDPTSLAQRVLALAADPAEVRRLGESARRAFSAAYSARAQIGPRLELITRNLRG
jgi:glycosyltransferase involved in cell wall biosynthesis